MFDIVLYEPEIPPNTGNIVRLASNTGARLHLVRPLGFHIDDRTLARAGLDYHERATLIEHVDWAACRAALSGRRWFALTTRGTIRYDAIAYARDDVFVFGPETRGLPDDVLGQFLNERRLRIPMRPSSRSLNLANAVAIVVYEAWRQQRFESGG